MLPPAESPVVSVPARKPTPRRPGSARTGNLIADMADTPAPEPFAANQYRTARCGQLRPGDIGGGQVRLAGG